VIFSFLAPINYLILKERGKIMAKLSILAILIAGFLVGISSFRAIQQIGGFTPVKKAQLNSLNYEADQLKSRLAEAQIETGKLAKAYDQIEKLKDDLDKTREKANRAEELLEKITSANRTLLNENEKLLLELKKVKAQPKTENKITKLLQGIMVIIRYDGNRFYDAQQIWKTLEKYEASLVLNEGTPGSPIFRSKIYISNDSVIDAAQSIKKLLADVEVFKIGKGQYSKIEREITIFLLE
jgi:hypothetical protein